MNGLIFLEDDLLDPLHLLPTSHLGDVEFLAKFAIGETIHIEEEDGAICLG